MASNDNLIPQHKLMAMGRGPKSPAAAGATGKHKEMARGGSSGRLLKTGTPDSPLENAKRNNGIPGFKAGGKAKK